ncbi:3'(2'),5'-bisphosphate nucleotidase CysQ [Candidatus Methylospira mobilis]|uniref:3'(2'),5'-bisphosphate nucleotidase CysQ n=2 Tax=Candidatus Methylospira mobilis TaxID=1808979 RepID=A0A5Q0BMM9_9GAMM|nr:3'(2'),5'-bisphosphate nucleotidase CysQ [Candidatus Methylospira mobilis]
MSYSARHSAPHREEPRALLEAVTSLVVLAGNKSLGFYHTDFSVGIKQDGSPVTEADLAVHHSLVGGLTAMGLGYPILSEESAATAYSERMLWTRYWLLDPLDGTREFINHNGEFTVNVALIVHGKPVLGVVYTPVTGIMYFAAEGCGAFKREGQGVAVPISVKKPADQIPAVVGSRSHKTPELTRYLERLGAHRLNSIGSSLKFCLVAEGAADVYPRMGLTSEWDTAAAQCIVEQAGGMVVDLRGNPLRYNSKESLLNPWFLVFGDNEVEWLRYAEGLEGEGNPGLKG